jgi:chemotaxis methyl-accepting protein methylase
MVSVAIMQRLRAGRFRHVAFASGLGARRAINFGAVAAGPEDQHPLAAGKLSGDESIFLRWLFRRAGLDVRHYRAETLQRRLAACLRALRASDVREAKAMLIRDGSLVAVAISAMVIGVTSFFRDSPVFDYLTVHVLATLRQGGRGARIWSAACSDGDEVYSVAMLLEEMKLLDGAYLLGTDCRGDAIRRARLGSYHSQAVKDVPEAWLEKYFTKEGVRYRISEKMRSAVQFRTADMMEICEPGSWDVILCRNAGMYLRPESAGRLWQRFEDVLRPGGYLVLGKAERPVGTMRLSAVAPCIYRRDQG